MKRVKRTIACILAVVLFLMSGSKIVFARTIQENESISLESKENEETKKFKKEVRDAGRKIAEERGLILSEEEFEQLRMRYARLNEANYRGVDTESMTQQLYRDMKSCSVSLEDIYLENPDLMQKAFSVEGLDQIYLTSSSNLGARTASETPEIGDYRLGEYYTYSEWIETDEVETDSFEELAELAIEIAAVGLKPAQAIVVTLLDNVIPTDSWNACSDYHLVTLSERCLSERWGEIYTFGGILGETEWRGYCGTSRTDVYAIAVAVTWKGNVCYSQTSDAVKMYYSASPVYRKKLYIMDRSRELYKAACENETLLFGVPVGWLEFNMVESIEFTYDVQNPFE